MPLKEIKRSLKLFFTSSVNSVSPRLLVRKELLKQNGTLIVRSQAYPLKQNCYVVGFGKAVLDMGIETECILKDHIQTGILSVPKGIVKRKNYGLSKETKIRVYEGAQNNVPDSDALKAATNIVSLVKSLKESDLLIILISGGGSALLPYPEPPVTLEEKVIVTQMLVRAGASIKELNCVRKKLSGVKGGKLASMAWPATTVALVLSDVVGDPLHYIAAGPTVPNSDSPKAPLDVLKKYSLLEQVPSSIFQHLHDKPDINIQDNFSRVQTVLIGNNMIALNTGKEAAITAGYDSFVVTSNLEGLVSSLARSYVFLSVAICAALDSRMEKASLCIKLKDLSSKLCFPEETVSRLIDFIYKQGKICLFFGGEPTVEVKGEGRGGRSQELALRFSRELDLHRDELVGWNVALLCGGTDGIDGPTPAAGAISYLGQTSLATQQGLNIDQYIANNDSYTYYCKLNKGEDLLKIGHTGTNVMDIHILILERN